MYPEAKGVLDVSLAEDQATAEDVTGSVLRAITEVMMNRPDAALKDLSNPSIGDHHDAPLWRAMAFAGQGKMGNGARQLQARACCARRSARRRRRQRKGGQQRDQVDDTLVQPAGGGALTEIDADVCAVNGVADTKRAANGTATAVRRTRRPSMMSSGFVWRAAE
jgi:hypothetical protein